jgi:hypothetical protein
VMEKIQEEGGEYTESGSAGKNSEWVKYEVMASKSHN